MLLTLHYALRTLAMHVLAFMSTARRNVIFTTNTTSLRCPLIRSNVYYVLFLPELDAFLLFFSSLYFASIVDFVESSSVALLMLLLLLLPGMAPQHTTSSYNTRFMVISKNAL